MLSHENHSDIFYVKNLLTTLRQAFDLTSIQIHFMKRNKFFALLISSNIFHWQDLQHLKKMLPFRYAFSREANRKSKISTC